MTRMDEPLEILVIEDSAADFRLIERQLERGGLPVRCHRVADLDGLTAALADRAWDVLLSDYNLPNLDFLEVLELHRAQRPDLPVILVSGSVGEERAVELLKRGVWDFVLKDRLARLVPAIEHSLREAAHRRAQLAAEEALRTSEAELQAALEMARAGHWVYDLARNVFTFNDAFYRIFRTTAEEEGGYEMSPEQYARRFCHPDDAALVAREVQAVIEAGEPGYSRQLEHRIRFADGGEGWIAVRFLAVTDGAGRVIGTRGVNQDITERLRLETEKELLEAQFHQAQRLEAVGRLAGGVAHDFNNLLQAMTSELDRLGLMGAAGDTLGTSLERLGKAVQRGAQLTRQLLLFARHERPVLERLDLGTVVADQEEFLRRLLREDIVLTLDPAHGPLPVKGDAGQIAQVVMNLALNAADAMPDGGTLRFTTGAEGDQVWLEVTDTGPGIPAEIRERIFEPFFTTKGRSKGTGLGLSVVHGIVAAHGGRITVASTPGTGTTFHITLPRRDDHELPATSSGDSGEAPARAPAGRERLLLVEDQGPVREACRGMLEELGYRVTAVGSCEAATALPGAPPFDLLLTDIVLPDGRGDRLAAQLRSRWPRLAVVLMSGYPGDELGAGAELPFDFLPKPFDARSLSRALAAATPR